MKNTKIITVSLAAALAIGAITANGVLVSADAEKGTIKVAASATPHAEILEEAKPILEKEGWDLEVTVFDDYVQPNLVVESGDFDANYFQHIPYLDNFNEEQGTHLVNAGGIHYDHLEFILEQRNHWMNWKMVIPLQFQTIRQTKREHFFFSRITV